MTGIDTALLKACHCCGLVQELPSVPQGFRASCARCGSSMSRPGRRATSNRRAVAAALAALILYPFAISMPIMRLERFGNFTEASIWTGSVGMLERGEVFVGAVVLVCSVVIPFLKLAGLLAITIGRRQLSKRHRARTYRMIEWAGRWGMLDVLLIAVVVAWIKIGDLVEVSAGPAALAFTVCVLLSLLASAWFDPHALWEESA
ncbi:MAG: paraquat-inducible protein A [Planctomycetota bacterium]|nr:MAG: paraquat-inducible protein A [Planctomycetota bacterium]